MQEIKKFSFQKISVYRFFKNIFYFLKKLLKRKKNKQAKTIGEN